MTAKQLREAKLKADFIRQHGVTKCPPGEAVGAWQPPAPRHRFKQTRSASAQKANEHPRDEEDGSVRIRVRGVYHRGRVFP